MEQGPVQHPPVLHRAHRGVVGAGGDRQARRRGQQTIGQGELIQQQTVQPAGVGGQQGFDQRGCGWCHLRTGMGVRSITGMARMRKPLDGHCAVVARMQRLVHPAQGGHKYEGQQQAGQPDHLPCARTGTRAHGGARTLVGPWQRQAHGR